MHILFATIDFVENNGPTTGLPKYLLRTSLKLVEWGHKVTVVTCSNRTVQYEYYGINVYRVRKYNIQRVNDEFVDEKNLCMRDAQIIHETISQIVKKEKIDIIQYASLSGIAFYHDFGIPTVVRLSSYAKMWPIIGQEERTRARTKMERVAANMCDAIISPSNVVANEFAKDINRRVDVIETPFVMEDTSEDYTLYNRLLKGKKYLLFFGTIIEYKGIKVIAEIVDRIFTSFSSLHIVVIGDGNKALINELKNRAGNFADRVIYHKAIGFKELSPIIKEAFAVMLPSLMENFSNACVEAMALGKIVIGTDGVSFEQLITDNVSGLLCKPGDADSLFSAVCRLMELNSKEKAEMEEKALKRITELAPENVTKQLLSYYREVIKNYNGMVDYTM